MNYFSREFFKNVKEKKNTFYRIMKYITEKIVQYVRVALYKGRKWAKNTDPK